MNRSHEHARQLLQKAREDAWMLEQMIAQPDAPDWGLGFHAQQAAEKAIKAVLAEHSIEYPLTHNLSVLLDRARGAGLPLPPDATEMSKLTPFGVMLRYEITQSAVLDRAWAQGVVRRTVVWAETLLAAPGAEP
jgi:hypothetical protein